MDINKAYGDLYKNFVLTNKLSDDDAYWPEDLQAEFNKAYSELMQKYAEESSAKKSADPDTEFDEEYYKIHSIVTNTDGVTTSTSDIREMSLEQLSKLASMFPQYNDYYFKKLRKSL